MFRKLFIKIGSKSIESYKKIIHVHENKEKEKIEDKTFEELIKQNKNKKKQHNKNIYAILLLITIIILSRNNIEFAFKLSTVIISYILLKRNIPKLKKEKRKKDILKEFPYALRQISTQLRAGIGLYDSIKSVADSKYGSLSEEFQITLNEIQYGTDYVNAFENFSKRNDISIIEKFVSQIIRTLNNGGNLADTLNSLADENSYNMKLKYKEYSEKLNAIMLLYMFIAVLFPVILFIMIIAATTVMGSIIKPELLLILYLLFFPLIIVFMIILIKRLEPIIN